MKGKARRLACAEGAGLMGHVHSSVAALMWLWVRLEIVWEPLLRWTFVILIDPRCTCPWKGPQFTFLHVFASARQEPMHMLALDRAKQGQCERPR